MPAYCEPWPENRKDRRRPLLRALPAGLDFLRQCAAQFLKRTGQNAGALGKVSPAAGQGEGQVLRVEFGTLSDERAASFDRGVQRRTGLAGKRERQERRSARRVGVRARGFLEHHECVGAPEPERIHRGEPRRAFPAPVAAGRVDEKRTVREIDLRIGPLEMQARGNVSVLQGKRRLDQRGDPRRLLEMADIGLDRPDRAEATAIRSGPERPGEGVDFQRIADDGAGAMAFDIADLVRLDARHRHRLDHRSRLRADAGGGVADLPPTVVVDRRATDRRVDGVAIGNRLRKVLEQDEANAAAEDRALGAGVERPAMSVRRQDPALNAHVARALRDADRRRACKRHVAFAGENCLAGEMDRDQ